MEFTKEEIIKIYGTSPYIDLDKVYDIIPQVSAKGIVELKPEYEFFRGHFPSIPVLPGILILDLMSKVAGTIFISDGKYKLDNMEPGFLSAGEEIKFRRAVNPGDILEIEVKKISEEAFKRKVECIGKVNGEEVTSSILEIKLV